MAVFEFDPPEMARVLTLPRAEPAPRGAARTCVAVSPRSSASDSPHLP
jgi:hypothetical protein